MSSYLTLLHSRSTNTLSNARPRPSRLTAIPASSRRPVYSWAVNWDPKSVFEDLRSAHRQSLFECLQAEPPFQRVRQSPREHVPAEPVDHRRQIHEAVPHGHVGDVRAPDLVDAGQLPIAEQVGIDPRVGRRDGGPGPGK